MKRTILITGTLILGLSLFGIASAVTIQTPWPPGGPEENLVTIYGNLFGGTTGFGTQVQGNPIFTDYTGNWRVNIIVRYAGLGQTFTSNITPFDQSVPNTTPPTPQANNFFNIPVTGGANFLWIDNISNGDSVASNSPDRFVAFQATGSEISFYNTNTAPQFGGHPEKSGNVFLIGFEDTPIGQGDSDFQDLVAVVEQVQGGGGVVPEPATMLLVGSGLLGMGVFARRRFKKQV